MEHDDISIIVESDFSVFDDGESVVDETATKD